MLPEALLGDIDFREKALKVLQYACRLAAARAVNRADALLWSRAAQSFASGRRLIKLLRWIKYGRDLRAAWREADEVRRRQLLAEVGMNLAIDTLQDLRTLEHLGLLRAGLLPSWVPRAVEWLDFAVSVNGLSLRASDSALSEADQKARNHRLDLFKYACDIVVTSHDVAARSVRLPTLQAPLLCGLASGAASASKLALKHVAAARPVLMSPRIPRYPGELKHGSWYEQSARQALGLQSP